jgi:asparagine synthase (glutamine-hydrolysing)
LFIQQLRHLIQSKLHGVRTYRILSRRRALASLKGNPWFTPELGRRLPDQEPAYRGSDLNARLAHSIRHDPLPIYLRVEDRNSMAHSVEARVPFLDHRLVSFVHGLSAEWKLRGPWNKFVLREGMRGRIPESVRSRVDKMGFPTSARQWFSDLLYEPMLDLLHSRRVRERGVYNIDNIVRDLDRHRSGEADVALKLFRVAQFEIWSELQDLRGGKSSAATRSSLKLATAI